MKDRQLLPLVLASTSPRRQALCRQMGLEFQTVAPNIDETPRLDETGSEYVQRVAREKAQQATKNLGGESCAILSADTIVVHNQEILGKPRDFLDAKRIWRLLSDTEHQVMSSICLICRNTVEQRLVTTDVIFAEITEQQMQRYWASGEPQDKAGGYAIQGYASAWVKEIKGSYSNVVGLPLCELNELLATIDLNWL